ncbi:hypothetical protein [Streptomyces rubradiris]|uniref:Uncharacterized protein n=1 Tax=Streptomyces rubradiris TaxID=285531 RepID=A0ABQ3R3K8_STRRR|nr:hypothetical protein [Streptomyces rubradiris]GHH30181.1 hypothetical protein GCM10018792_76330 [Streptomyces rubradiris]GHI50414.1 hypothetical protein Srubr_02600 [Streptomyces rubradiris]
MNALETVERWIESLQILASHADSPTEEQRAEMAAVRQRMLHAYVHELANQQRAVGFDWYEEHAEGAVMARDYLADLIDSHVGAGPVRPDEEPVTGDDHDFQRGDGHV